MEKDSITVGSLARGMQSRLSPIYGESEAKAMVRLIFHSLKGWSLTDMMIHSDNPVSQYMLDKTGEIVVRLLKNEPIQYILGEAYFYGMNLKVNRSTLIPRPETEELADLIIQENGSRKDLRVLDIGTGSGAIAIALSRNLPFADVMAIDISSDALRTAEESAESLHCNIRFMCEDIFRYEPMTDSLDIIVSNPPYIDESEKDSMEKNVLEYEPHSALFVPDNNPLIYYTRIAEIATDALQSEGRLYFEINPRHSSELATYLENEGFADVCVIKDINGKERFIKCRKR